jgi:hypothetical protein
VSNECNETQLVVEAADRHTLVLGLVDRLRALLRDTGEWGSGATVVPWQASAEAFDQLPREVLGTLVDAWEHHGGRCVDLELDGYLETDNGPRAWGTVVMRDDLPPARQPMRLDRAKVAENGGRYHLEVAIHLPGGGDA